MRCVQVGIVRVRMLGVIETCASVMGDAAAVSCRAAVSFAFADMQMPDLMHAGDQLAVTCLLYTSPSPRDATLSRMPSSA